MTDHERFVEGETAYSKSHPKDGKQHKSHGATDDHDPVHDPETATEVQDARNAAIDRRTPPDPDAPAASPDSGKPGAVPSPDDTGSPSDPDTPLDENPAYHGDPYRPADE